MSKIITFMSSAGGVGKTTLALNSAYYLSKKHRVLLVDFSLFGGLDVVLRQNKRGTGIDVLYAMFEKDQTFDLDKGSITIDSIGCDVIVSGKPLVMEKISSEFIVLLMDQIEKKNYDYVIFDTSSELSERNARLAQNSNDIICLTTQDISVSWRTLKYIEILERLQVDRKNLFLVLNHFRKDVEFNILDFEEEARLKLSGKLPYLKGIVTDVENSGKFILSSKGKPFKKLFKQLWED